MLPLWAYSRRHETVVLPHLCALCAREKPSCAFKVNGRHFDPIPMLPYNFIVVKNILNVPLCDKCVHRALRFRRSILLVALAAGIVIFIVTYNFFEQRMQPDLDLYLLDIGIGLFFAVITFSMFYYAGHMIKSLIDPASDIVRYDIECQRFFFKNEEYQAIVMELNREGYYLIDYPLQK